MTGIGPVTSCRLVSSLLMTSRFLALLVCQADDLPLIYTPKTISDAECSCIETRYSTSAWTGAISRCLFFTSYDLATPPPTIQVQGGGACIRFLSRQQGITLPTVYRGPPSVRPHLSTGRCARLVCGTHKPRRTRFIIKEMIELKFSSAECRPGSGRSGFRAPPDARAPVGLRTAACGVIGTVPGKFSRIQRRPTAALW
jgi:hypothetical protein